MKHEMEGMDMDFYYSMEHDPEGLEMKERMKASEVEERYVALPNEVKAYLSLTEALMELVPAQRTALATKQQEYLGVINQNPELQSHLANFLSFRNERRTIKG